MLLLFLIIRQPDLAAQRVGHQLDKEYYVGGGGGAHLGSGQYFFITRSISQCAIVHGQVGRQLFKGGRMLQFHLMKQTARKKRLKEGRGEEDASASEGVLREHTIQEQTHTSIVA